MRLSDVMCLVPSLLKCKAVGKNLEELIAGNQEVVKRSHSIIDEALREYSDALRKMDKQLSQSIERQYQIAETSKWQLEKSGLWPKGYPADGWSKSWEIDRGSDNGAVIHVGDLWREYKRLADEWASKYPAPAGFHWNGTYLQGPAE